MNDTIKMTKEFVEEKLSIMKEIIEVAEDDLRSFENINDRVLTDGNCAASRSLKNLKDTNEQALNRRKTCISEAVENLKTACAKLLEYAEAVGLN